MWSKSILLLVYALLILMIHTTWVWGATKVTPPLLDPRCQWYSRNMYRIANLKEAGMPKSKLLQQVEESALSPFMNADHVVNYVVDMRYMIDAAYKNSTKDPLAMAGWIYDWCAVVYRDILDKKPSK